MGTYGILFFDNSERRTLAEKFRAAADEFARKNKGRRPEFGAVREDMLNGTTLTALIEEVGFHLIPSSPRLPVQPGHIFVGAECLPQTAEEMDE